MSKSMVRERISTATKRNRGLPSSRPFGSDYVDDGSSYYEASASKNRGCYGLDSLTGWFVMEMKQEQHHLSIKYPCGILSRD